VLRIDDYQIARLRHAEKLQEAEQGRLAARVNRQERKHDSRQLGLRLQALLAR
jgi:hypothetical protein